MPSLPALLSIRSPHGRRRGLAGQALVLFLVLVGVLCLGLMLLFDSGQAVSKKVRLVNTADAAAYSVAVQQAKMLNFAAYMNRARIANEVAIAQFVSMWSWLNMIHTHTLSLIRTMQAIQVALASTVIGATLIPIVKGVETGLKIAEKAVAVARTVAHPALGPVVGILSRLNQAYAGAARFAVGVGATAEGLQVARRVVEKNDPNASIPVEGLALLGRHLASASSLANGGLLESYDPDGVQQRDRDGMNRFRNVVMASRDKFSADRGDNGGIPQVLEAGSWGGTDLVDYKRWAGMDIVQIQVGPVEALSGPAGWGGAQAIERATGSLPSFTPPIRSGPNNSEGWVSHPHDNAHYEPYGGASGNAAQMADTYPSVNGPTLITAGASSSPRQRRDAYFSGYTGLHAYHDVRDDRARTPEGADAGPRFTVYVVSAAEHARTSEHIDGIGGPVGGVLELQGQTPRGGTTAIATGQTYFNRPPRLGMFTRRVPRNWNAAPVTDTQLEAGSLFSPFWQARLVETPAVDYAVAGVGGVMGGGMR